MNNDNPPPSPRAATAVETANECSICGGSGVIQRHPFIQSCWCSAGQEREAAIGGDTSEYGRLLRQKHYIETKSTAQPADAGTEDGESDTELLDWLEKRAIDGFEDHKHVAIFGTSTGAIFLNQGTIYPSLREAIRNARKGAR